MFVKPFHAMLLGAFCLTVAPLQALPALDGVYSNGMCWNSKVIEVHFNPVLAVELENPYSRDKAFPSIGSSVDRKKTMQFAIDAWNEALKSVGAVSRLKLVETRAFGAKQGNVACYDSDFRGEAVYSVDYSRHEADGYSISSTSDPSRSAARGFGAGWVIGTSVTPGEIDRRLAETNIAPRPNEDAATIREADLIWFTHVTDQHTRCSAIRWNYQTGLTPVANPYFDFYSVMLHQLGHFLGLDHLKVSEVAPATPPKNAMKPLLEPGERTAIGERDLESLKALYGPSGRCGNPKK